MVCGRGCAGEHAPCAPPPPPRVLVLTQILKHPQSELCTGLVGAGVTFCKSSYKPSTIAYEVKSILKSFILVRVHIELVMATSPQTLMTVVGLRRLHVAQWDATIVTWKITSATVKETPLVTFFRLAVGNVWQYTTKAATV